MYKFEKVNEDTCKLITENKEFVFTRDVQLAKELQSVDLETSIILAEKLAERGETIDNTKLRFEIKKGNQTIVDESNLNMVKEECRKLASLKVLDRIFNLIFGLSYAEILNEAKVDYTKEEEVSLFTSKLAEIITKGMQEDTPREQS